MTPEPQLADQADRDQIASALDDTLIVEAAAGTGKTTELIRRIVRVIETGRAEATRIVAVTFTEKAAGELKLRLREALEEARGVAAADSDERRRFDETLGRLEETQLSTIHGFCADLLRERPVEAGVDPLFTVLTEAQARGMFESAFHNWFQAQLADPSEGIQRSLRRPVFAGFGGGIEKEDGPVDRLRKAGWELAQWRDFDGDWHRAAFDRRARVDALVKQLEEFTELLKNPAYPNDNLYQDTRVARQFSEEIRRVEAVAERDYKGLEADLVELSRNRQFQRARKGYGKTYKPGVAREDLWRARDSLQSALTAFEADANADLAALLCQELRECVNRYQEAKAKAGALDFLDLLLKARDLVLRDADVRQSFQNRFKRIFVDEFQDTDPLQAELLLLLAADNPAVTDWRQVRPVPGKLFMVGDPKQSIYRFRRADVGIYQSVYAMLEAAGARRVTLRTNFRARPNIQRAINAAFERVMTGDEKALQAGYVPLEPSRPDVHEQPSVVVLPVPKPYGAQRIANTAIEDSLPDAVGAYVEWLIQKSGWKVSERPAIAHDLNVGPVLSDRASVSPGFSPSISRAFLPGEQEHLVPIQARHICLLFRRFVSWEQDVTRLYVEALEARGIAHLLVGGRSFHNRGEIETIRAALAAIEWPDDELSVFATLRSSLFAIGDEELLEFRHRFGHFHPFRIPKDLAPVSKDVGPVLSDRPPGVPSERPTPDLFRLVPIAEALWLLQSLHLSRNHVPVATTIAQLLEATRAHVRFALEHGGEQVLANVLHVADLARRYETEGGLSFRGFIDQLREQAENGDAGEAPILEEGSDGVRLMTVHKAKGLEFPVVILADLTTKLRRAAASRYIDVDQNVCAVQLAGCSPSDLLQHQIEELAREEAEGVRVAYVAATRARDLLVVPAVGDEEREGWIQPLNTAIYPPVKGRREQKAAPGCPQFRSKDSVLIRPNGDPAMPNTVSPGLHVFGTSHSVVWWDPRPPLNLGAEAPLGIRRPELIVKDVAPAIVKAGLAEYEGWRTRRDTASTSGARPTIEVRTVTEWARAKDEEAANQKLPEVEIIELPRAGKRPSGPRFGTLVHAVLATVPLEAERDVIERLTATHGRTLGASDEELESAEKVVQIVLTHPLLQRTRAASKLGRCRREVPIAWIDGRGGLIEGVVDLAFEEEGTWTLVDFKTDEEIEAAAPVYLRQLGVYTEAIRQSSGRAVFGALVRL